jgi:hypothetical protein
MSTSKSTSLREAVAELTANPRSECALERVASELATLIADKAQPDMSLGALLRWNASALDTGTRSILREQALSIVKREQAEQGSTMAEPARFGEWLTVTEAAVRLRIREATLLERLRTWEGRRRLGWPQWDGHRWRISSVAVDPADAASHLASLCVREPLAELLPEWCERQPDAA